MDGGHVCMFVNWWSLLISIYDVHHWRQAPQEEGPAVVLFCFGTTQGYFLIKSNIHLRLIFVIIQRIYDAYLWNSGYTYSWPTARLNNGHNQARVTVCLS